MTAMQRAILTYKRHGGHFFDEETLRFWGSKVVSNLYENRCFVTVEDNFNRTESLYTVRRFTEDYQYVETVGEFQGHTNREDAIEVAKGVKG